MIEHGMVFALGFCTAGLLALACLPAVWNRALRLTSARLRQLVPLSDEEIEAENSGLRAQAAVAQRRLEQRLEANETLRSGLLVDLARRDARLLGLQEDAARDAKRIADLKGSLAEAEAETADHRAQNAAANIALHGLEALAERRLYDVAAAEAQGRVLNGRIDEARTAVAALETRVLGLDTSLADTMQRLDRTREDLARSIASERQLTAERSAARQDAAGLAAKRDQLQSALDRSTAELGRQTERAVEAEARAVVRTQAAVAQAETTEELRAQLARQAAAYATVCAERDALRSSHASPRPGRPASEDADLDVLRDALRKVADDVLRLTGAGAPDGGRSQVREALGDTPDPRVS